jgi:hypothetical protein
MSHEVEKQEWTEENARLRAVVSDLEKAANEFTSSGVGGVYKRAHDLLTEYGAKTAHGDICTRICDLGEKAQSESRLSPKSDDGETEKEPPLNRDEAIHRLWTMARSGIRLKTFKAG